ncbi:MAG: 2-C-methyl-D-erythritol 4-phosphate cytidylyltransferase [Bacteroidales bacterium]|nr:2-C-methyl-D-erythritol 4-phosphate cytidylyltransferase [Bacteroidales bacterium]
MNIAVILAGGTGSRMGGSLPKQFLDLDGRPVIVNSIEAFDSHPAIDEVAVVIHPDWRGRMEEIVAQGHWQKVKKIIDGGSERYMSSLNAIIAYIDEPDDTNLLLHDAARPFLSADIIDRVVSALERHDAVGVAVPSTDTVWEVHPDFIVEQTTEISRFVARIPERKLMWRAQTPQAFRLPLIRDAYQRALQDPRFQATDDCGVVRKYMPGTKITVVEGNERNRKITFPEDLQIATNNN